MDFQITTGTIKGAIKTVIYGAEGIGKSTLAAKFPKPLFIDTEGGTKNLDVSRLPAPTSWEMLLQEIDYVIATRPCKTLITDTIDWAEQLCIADLCAKNGKAGIEDFGYGKGWEYEKESFGKFLNKLTEVINAGINVTLIAHASMRKFEQPDEMGSYDRWEMKLGSKTTNKIAPLVKEWADVVLFCNYKTMVIQTDKEGKKHKAQGNKRVMYTTHHPCWDAKNRYGLPEEIPMDYEQIRFIYESNTAPVQNVPQKPAEAPAQAASEIIPPHTESPAQSVPEGIPRALADLMKASNINEQQIRAAVSKKGYFPADMKIADYPQDFVEGVLIGAWDQIVKFIGTFADDTYPF